MKKINNKNSCLSAKQKASWALKQNEYFKFSLIFWLDAKIKIISFLIFNIIAIFFIYNIQVFSANQEKYINENCYWSSVEALWEFNESTWAIAIEKTWNFTWALINTTSRARWHISWAIVLNGKNQFVDIPEWIFSNNNQYTISAWFELENLWKQIIFSSNNWSSLKTWPLYISQDQKLWTLISNNEFTWSTTVQAWKWYQATFIFNKNEIKIYLNWKLEKSIFWSFPTLSSTWFKAWIWWDGFWNYFQWKIDEVLILNTLISDEQIQANFKKTLSTNCSLKENEIIAKSSETNAISIKSQNQLAISQKAQTSSVANILEIKFKPLPSTTENGFQEIIWEIKSSKDILDVTISVNDQQNFQASLVNYENWKWFFYKTIQLTNWNNSLVAIVTDSSWNQNKASTWIILNIKNPIEDFDKIKNLNSAITITSPLDNQKLNTSTINIKAELSQKDIIKCDIIKNDKQRQKLNKISINSNVINGSFKWLTEWLYNFKAECLDRKWNYYYDQIDNILIDTVAPRASISINNWNTISATSIIILDLDYDENSKCRYSDSDSQSTSWSSCSRAKIWTLSGSYWIKEIVYEVKDEAWNISNKKGVINYIENIVPEAINLDFEWINVIWQQISLEYLYYSKNEIPEGSSKYKWLISNTQTWEFLELPLANKEELLLENEFINKWIKFEVYPYSSIWNLNGSWSFESKTIFIHWSWSILKNKPTQINQYFTLNQIKDSSLSGNYISTIIFSSGQKLNLSNHVINEKTNTAQAGSVSAPLLIKNVISNLWINSNLWEDIISAIVDLWPRQNEVVIASKSETWKLIYLNIANNSKIYAAWDWDWTIEPVDITNHITTSSWLIINKAVSITNNNAFLIIDKKIKIKFSHILWDPYFTYGTGGQIWQQITEKCDDISWSWLTFPNNCYIKTNNSTTIWTHYLTDYSIQSDQPLSVVTWNKLLEDHSMWNIEPNLAPSATWVFIDWEWIIWNPLVWNYSYSWFYLEWKSKFNWYTSNSQYSTEFEKIPWANYLQYFPTKEDTLKFVTFEVIPITESWATTTWQAIKSTPIGPIQSLQLTDYSTSTSTTININESSNSLWNINLQQWKSQIKLNDFQKLDLNKNIKSLDAKSTTIWARKISIKDAMKKIGDENYIKQVVKSIRINSWIAWEDISLYSSDNYLINISDWTIIYGGDLWDWTISAAIHSSWSITPPPGTINKWSLSVGNNAHILFDKKIKIEIPSSSWYPYYSSNWSDWIAISQECNDNFASSLIFPDICYKWEWDKTNIWTYHFTDFGVFNSSSWILAVESNLVISSWAISIGYPNNLNFPNLISTENSQDIYLYSDDYFWIEDLKSSNSGYYLTMSVSDMLWPISSISANNIQIKVSSWITTLSWSEITQIIIPPSTASWFNIFPSASPVTVIKRDLNTWGKIWKYWIKPTFKITIPAFQYIWSYMSTISYDLIEN